MNFRKLDIVVSADWLPALERKAADMIIDSIYDLFDKNDLEQLGRVIVLRTDESFVDKILEINNSQLFDTEINGLSIKKLFVISSQRQIYRDEQKLINLIKKFGLDYEELEELLISLDEKDRDIKSLKSNDLIIDFYEWKQNKNAITNSHEGRMYGQR